MSALPTWSVRNRVAVNIFAIALLIAGAVAGFSGLTRALFPDVDTNFIRIITMDPTTSVAEDIERVVTIPIEEELANVEGLKKLISYSQDNVSIIFLELEADITNVDPVLNEVRQAVDKAKPELPDSAEVPIVEKFDIPMPLATMSVMYPPTYDVRKARDTLDRIERRLRVVPGVSEVLVDGLEDREVWVEVDPYQLEGIGVSFEQLAELIRRKNVNAVGGRIDAAGGERVVRVMGEVQTAAELEEMAVREHDGRVVMLRDIATVKATSEEEQTRGRTNLRPAITYTIVKKKGADAIDVVNRARAVFEEQAKLLPEGFEARVTTDSTKYIDVRIQTVLENGVTALILVSLLLILFLNWRLGLIVAIGLPISFAGTFVVLFVCGYTINLLSLFAMIMALGMVVDDAVVIAENSFRLLEAGHSPAQAAIRGAGEVFWPVIGSVSTTVAAFLPLMLGEGIIGKFLLIVPIVVVSTLAFSLLQAFLVLPSHFADFVRRTPSVEEMERRAEARRGIRRQMLHAAIIYKELRNFINRGVSALGALYLHLLNISLRRRYFVVLGFVLSLIAVGVALALGVVRFQLFAADFADRLIVKLDLPADYSLDQTEAIVMQVEDAIVRELPPDDLSAIVTRIGGRLDPTNQFIIYGTNIAMISVDIDEQNPKCRMPSVIERDLNRILGRFPQFTTATAESEGGGPPVGRAANVEIQGPDLQILREIAAKVEQQLHQMRGVFNISNDFERGKTEYRVKVDEAKAIRAGLDVAAVGRALQGAFLGLEAAKVRWGNDEVTIRVRMEERFQQDPELLQAFRIRNARGEMIDLSSVATIERTSGIARIKRQNQERLLTVSADVDDRVTTSAEVNAAMAGLAPEIIGGYPGYTINLAGENEDTERSLASMKFAALVALLLIYTLLATISNSFVQPVVIMLSAIPFGIVGVMIGLILMGEPLGLMSIMGTIALTGIVVNNSVVFLDFINQYRRAAAGGGDARGQVHALELSSVVRWRSIMNAGRTRLRPIFLTTATTIAGLMGLAFTTSGQEQFLAPMAQAIVFGLSFGTIITMVLLPCLYSILDDANRRLALWFRSEGEAVGDPVRS